MPHHTWRVLTLVLLVLTLATPVLAGSVRCTTYDEKSLRRLRTLCDNGTRATHTYNKTLSRWESTITAPPGETCTGRVNPRTQQWEGRCR